MMELKFPLEEKTKKNFLEKERKMMSIQLSRGGVGDVCCCFRPDARDHSTIKCRSFHVKPFNAIKARSASWKVL